MARCKTKERKAKRAAELKKSKAKKEEVGAELARLVQDSKEEEKRVEVKRFLRTLSLFPSDSALPHLQCGLLPIPSTTKKSFQTNSDTAS